MHHFPLMKDAMVLRNGLAPYIYTAARDAHDTGTVSSIKYTHTFYPTPPKMWRTFIVTCVRAPDTGCA